MRRPPKVRLLQALASLPAVLVVLSQPVSASATFSLGKTGLPSSWIGEALMVALAFALPAMLAGLSVMVSRLLQKRRRRDAFGPRL